MISKIPDLALRVFGIACLALFALSAMPSEAQTPMMVFRVKFTCGFAPGNIPDSGSFATVLPVPYREVQPGNYSTVINILNARFNGRDSQVGASILVQGRPVASLSAFTLTSFSTVRIDCDDITGALAEDGFQADGRFVEGFIQVTARDPIIGAPDEPSDLEVSAVYTYGSRRTDTGGTGLGSSIDIERIVGKPEIQPE